MYRYHNYLKNHFSFIFCSFVLIFPLFFFDVNDYEEYGQGFYSVKYFYSSLYNFFSNYDFNLGLGVSLPIGQGLNFYPTSIFSFNYKIFLITTITFNFYIQYYFFLRLSNILNISLNNFYIFSINFLLLSTFINIAYTYFNDWISIHTLYSLFFALIFYLIKFGIKKKNSSLNKFTLFFLLSFINCHLAFLLFNSVFLLFIVIFNIKKFKINSSSLFLPIFVSCIICVPKTIELFIIYKNSANFMQQFQNFENISYTLLYPINFILRAFDFFFNTDFSYKVVINSFSLGYGPQLIFGLFISLILIIKKKSSIIFHLDKIYLLGFLLILFINFIPIGNYSIFLRDCLNIIFLVIFISFLDLKILKKFKHLILIILLLSNILMFVESLRFLKFNDIEYKTKKLNLEYPTEFKNYLNLISKKEQTFFRIYLSEKVFFDINNKENIFFKTNGIYTPKDFVFYDLNIFNVSLKNHLNSKIRIPKIIMRDEFHPINEEIGNNFLMNFYRIKYLLVYELEAKKIDLSNFIVEKSFTFDDKNLLILRNLNFGTNFIVDKKNDLKKCDKELIIRCLIDNQKVLIKNDNIKISELINNKIMINNMNDKSVNILVPFVKNNFWEFNKKNLIYNKFEIINLKAREKFTIKYNSFLYLLNKIIMVLTLFLFIYYIYFYKPIHLRSNKS